MDYYSYRHLDTGEWQGLLRFDRATGAYEYATADGWKAGDREDTKMFFLPGADAPERISRADAARLAVRYGVAL